MPSAIRAVGPRLRPSRHPCTQYPCAWRMLRSGPVDESLAMKPGSTSTGCSSPRPIARRSGDAAATAPSSKTARDSISCSNNDGGVDGSRSLTMFAA